MRLLLADDHHLVREALSFFLRQTAEDVVVSEAGTLDEALKIAASAPRFDAVILDYRMPGMAGLTGVQRMRALVPDVPVVILSGNITRTEAAEALRNGAAGVISKELRGPALINALRLVLAGEVYMPTALIDEPGETEADRREAEKAERAALGSLTRRELEVVKLLSGGHSNREIAGRLDLAEVTVKLHLHNAFEKMGARSRADAVRIVHERGIARPTG